MKAMRVPAILVCVLSASAAFAETSPAERLPFDHWAYDALQQISELTGYSPYLDRDRHLAIRDRAVAEEVGALLSKLVREFWPEIEGLGAREQLAAVPPAHWFYPEAQQLLREIETGKINQPHVTAPDDPFPDVPTHHWAFDAVEKLRKTGIIVGHPDGTFQ